MDRQSIYTTHTYVSNFEDSTDTRIQLQTQLESFILGFRLDNNYVYRYVSRQRCGYYRVNRSTTEIN